MNDSLFPMPVFTIKAKDALSVSAMIGYRELCLVAGLEDQAYQVDLAIAEVREWQRLHPDKMQLPDHQHVAATT